VDHDQEQAALWVEFRYTINNPGDDVVARVNELLLKNPWLEDEGEKLQIPKGRGRLHLAVDEPWPLSRLWPLIHPKKQVTEEPPKSEEGAILVLRWRRPDLLIDGRRRINLWHREKKTSPHRVIILERAA
jgi:hypothetical protein